MFDKSLYTIRLEQSTKTFEICVNNHDVNKSQNQNIFQCQTGHIQDIIKIQTEEEINKQNEVANVETGSNLPLIIITHSSRPPTFKIIISIYLNERNPREMQRKFVKVTLKLDND